MGRRASSGLNAAAIAGIAVAVVVLIGAGALLLRDKNDSFAGTPLPVEDVLTGANSLAGNEYTVEGTIHERIPRDTGLLLAVLVKSGDKEESNPIVIPIVVPPEVATINLERNSAYAFKVRVGEGGIPIATNVKRL